MSEWILVGKVELPIYTQSTDAGTILQVGCPQLRLAPGAALGDHEICGILKLASEEAERHSHPDTMRGRFEQLSAAPPLSENGSG